METREKFQMSSNLALFVVIIWCFCTISQCTEKYQEKSKNVIKVGFISQALGDGVAEFVFKHGIKRTKYLLPGYSITYMTEDTKCNPKIGMKVVLDLQKKLKNLDAIIGSMCSLVCQPVGLLAAAWNVPQISSRCSGDFMSEKKMYPTFSRTRGNIMVNAKVIVNILKIFGWRQFSIITSDSSAFKRLAIHLQKLSDEKGINAQVYTLSTTMVNGILDQENLAIMKQVVTDIRVNSRIVVLFLYDVDLRHFLLLASQGGLTGFVFIGLSPAYRGSKGVRYIMPKMSDAELYQGIVALTEDVPSTHEYEIFYKDMASVLSRVNSTQQGVKSYFALSAGEVHFILKYSALV